MRSEFPLEALDFFLLFLNRVNQNRDKAEQIDAIRLSVSAQIDQFRKRLDHIFSEKAILLLDAIIAVTVIIEKVDRF